MALIFCFRVCSPGCLDKDLVKGKIVFCNGSNGIIEGKRVGALGSVVSGEINDVSFVVPYAASSLSFQQFSLVEGYINSTK